MTITLFFKEGKDKRLYLQFANSIKFIEYENAKKTISIWKNSNFICDLDEKFLIDSSKVSYKKEEENAFQKKVCVNCNNPTSHKRINELPINFLTKFVEYMRCLSTYEQLKVEQNDLLNYVNPIVVLEHKEEEVGEKGDRQHYTELKIGLMRTDKSNLPIPLKRNYPKLQNKDFSTINKNVMIRNGKVEVCEDCYFLLNNVYNMTDSDMKAKILKKEYNKNFVHNFTNKNLGKNDEENEEHRIKTPQNFSTNHKEYFRIKKERIPFQSKFSLYEKANSIINKENKLDKYRIENAKSIQIPLNKALITPIIQESPFTTERNTIDTAKFINYKDKDKELLIRFNRQYSSRNGIKLQINPNKISKSNIANSLNTISSNNNSRLYSATTAVKTPKYLNEKSTLGYRNKGKLNMMISLKK